MKRQDKNRCFCDFFSSICDINKANYNLDFNNDRYNICRTYIYYVVT